ncbi:MAG: hypothetical protein ACFCD0_21800 [Gemmataceae bacterium]
MPLLLESQFPAFDYDNAFFMVNACELAEQNDDALKTEAVKLLGMDEDSIVPFHVVGEEDDDPTDYRGFVGTREDAAILAFRDVPNIDHWLTDEMCEQKPSYGGMIHKGFAEALDSVWSLHGDEIQGALEGKTVFVTGHGLGGALAVLAASKLNTNGVAVQQVYTFGCPRVGNMDFYHNYEIQTYRVVNYNDIYTHVPAEIVSVRGFHLYTYAHVGALIHFDRFKQREGELDWNLKKQIILEQLLKVGQPPSAWFQDHHITAYREILEQFHEPDEEE